MQVNRGRPAQNTVAYAFTIILQPKQCTDLEDADISDTESDHISEPIDRINIESA